MKKLIILVTIFIFFVACEEVPEIENVDTLDSLNQLAIEDSLQSLDSLRQIDSLNTIDSLIKYEWLVSLLDDFNRLQGNIYTPLDTIHIDKALVDTFEITDFYFNTHKMSLRQNSDDQYYLEIPEEDKEQIIPIQYYSLVCSYKGNSFKILDSMKTYFSRAAFSTVVISISQASFTFSKGESKTYRENLPPDSVIRESTQEYYYKDKFSRSERITNNNFYGYGTTTTTEKLSFVKGVPYPLYSCTIKNKRLNLGLKYSFSYYSGEDSHSHSSYSDYVSLVIQDIAFDNLLNTNNHIIIIKGKTKILEVISEIRYESQSSFGVDFGDSSSEYDKLIDYEFNENSFLTVTLERK